MLNKFAPSSRYMAVAARLTPPHSPHIYAVYPSIDAEEDVSKNSGPIHNSRATHSLVVPVPESCQSLVKAAATQLDQPLNYRSRPVGSHILKANAPAKTADRKTTFLRNIELQGSQSKLPFWGAQDLLVDTARNLGRSCVSFVHANRRACTYASHFDNCDQYVGG